MQANEKLYELMERVSSQLEAMTCAFAVHIENAGLELEQCKYKVFNDFYNEARKLEIESIVKIQELFQESQQDILRILGRVKAEESSITQMENKLSEMQDGLVRLSIHMENIREINSTADTVIIPDPKSKLYDAFSGYGKILEKYKTLNWDSDNAFESIIVSFFNISIGIFEQLCMEFDTRLHQIGLDIDKRQEYLKTNSAIELAKKYELPIKRKSALDAATDIGVALGKVAVKTLGMVAGENNLADVAVTGVSLLAKVSEAIGEPKPKHSRGRELLHKAQKKIEAYDAALELSGVIIDGNVPDSSAAATKIITGALLLKNNSSLEKLLESGQLERVINIAGLISSAGILVKPVKTPKDVAILLKNGLNTMNYSVNIFKDIAENIAENKNRWSYPFFKKVNMYFKEYENNKQVYQIQRKQYGFAKKVKPPPGVKAINCIALVCDIIDVFS